MAVNLPLMFLPLLTNSVVALLLQLLWRSLHFLHLTHMSFAKAGHPAFLFVVGAVACAAALLFWPVEVIMVGFFTVREFHKLWPTACSSGSRQTGWLPPSPNSTI